LKIGSLESEKIIIGYVGSEKIGSLYIHTGYLTFSLKKACYQYHKRMRYMAKSRKCTSSRLAVFDNRLRHIL